MPRALAVGLSGPELTIAEAEFLQRVRPCGIIIFSRNIVDRQQLRRLIDDARTAIDFAPVLVLVDQEGGRVQRLRPPVFETLPAAAAYGALYQRNPPEALAAAKTLASYTALLLAEFGINTNCVPCADIPVPGAHAIIGERAYGDEVGQVVALARAVAEGHLSRGVLPVLKHVPGHGRANADSHLALPVVTAGLDDLIATDFAAFRLLRDLPAAMTAHVVFDSIDPSHPASTSRLVIDRMIRGEIGFDGLLMSDDLSMKALEGSIAERSAAVIAAGCDIALHCNGELDEMEAAASAVHDLTGRALDRFHGAAGRTGQHEAGDVTELTATARTWLAKLLDEEVSVSGGLG
ncbi:MAG TPA: beta-N-acetylhexosaminidase [Hyphomicrobiaceae bacterium]|nr:beta-N-acetylhexosaminidase [Hyphomicrobiaceae bacterium]